MGKFLKVCDDVRVFKPAWTLAAGESFSQRGHWLQSKGISASVDAGCRCGWTLAAGVEVNKAFPKWGTLEMQSGEVWKSFGWRRFIIVIGVFGRFRG